MAEEPGNLILRQLRRMDAKLDQVVSDISESKTRVGRLEKGVAELHVALAEQSVRIDKMDARLQRIERRLELADA